MNSYNQWPQGLGIYGDEMDLDNTPFVHSAANDRRQLGLPPLPHIKKEHGEFAALRDMPPEVLMCIFQKITDKADQVRLMTVCKLWANILVEQVWFRPLVNSLRQLNKFLSTMKLHETTFPYRLLIKRLNFSFVGDFITDEALELFIGSVNMERLTLVCCKNITSNTVSKVLQGCSRLQSVDITGIREIADDVFQTLAVNCLKLQGLYAPMCRQVSPQAIHTFISSCPGMKRIKITDCPGFDDILLDLMASTCPLLVEVDIQNSDLVTTRGVVNMFSRLENLREFKLSANSNVTDDILLSLPSKIEYLPALRLIDLTGCMRITDRLVEKLVALAPKLRNVFLSKCVRITDTSLRHLARLGRTLHTVHFGHCNNITDDGVRELLRTAHRLQYIDFACCTQLTNQTLIELAQLPKLKRIGLVKCTNLTDDGLLNMIQLRGANDTLERVHLSYCLNLSIFPIYRLLMSCPRLTHLSLTAIPSFLRSDIVQFIRDPPADFTPNQRQLFCVFSGNGVKRLREYLRRIMDHGINDHFHTSQLTDHANMLLGGRNPVLIALHRDNRLRDRDDFQVEIPFFTGLGSVFHPQNTTLVDIRISPTVPLAVQFAGASPQITHHFLSELDRLSAFANSLANRSRDFNMNVQSLMRVPYQYANPLRFEMTRIKTFFVALHRELTDLHDRVHSDMENLDQLQLYCSWEPAVTARIDEQVGPFTRTCQALLEYVVANDRIVDAAEPSVGTVAPLQGFVGQPQGEQDDAQDDIIDELL